MPIKVAENIYKLDVPLKGSPLKNLNSYIIMGEKNLLVDTGFRTDDCRAAIMSELDELSVRLEDTDIFLTHLHADHAGLSSELHRVDRYIFMSDPDLERMLGYISGAGWKLSDRAFVCHGFPENMLGDLVSTNPARAFAPASFEDYTIIEHGRRFSYGGYDFEAVSTPGHTPGHMCLYEAQSGIMLLGDCVLFDITPNITAWDGFDNSLGAYLNSLKMLKNYNVTKPLVAHRAFEGDFNERIDALLSHHEHRLDECLGIVKGSPGLVAYDIAGHMKWSIRCNSWEDFPTVQKWFAVGETVAHLDHLISLGLVKREDESGFMRHYAI